MRLTPPTHKTLFISSLLAVASVIPLIFGFTFVAYLLVAGALVNLTLGNILKGY